MATDYAEKERAFIEALQDDTGKDLAGWMVVISQAKLDNRNDIIDWLRHQGFQFAKASWLERIHHNGGRLIYADDTTFVGAVAETAVGDAADQLLNISNTDVSNCITPIAISTSAPPPVSKVQIIDLATRKHVAQQAAYATARLTPATFDLAVADILTHAKGLRPLAELVLSEVLRTIPHAIITARAPLVVVSAPKPVLALWPQAKKLRVYADLDAASGGDRVKVADTVLKAPPPFARMITLDDARSVDRQLAALIASACARANPK